MGPSLPMAVWPWANGAKLIFLAKCLYMLEASRDMFPAAKYQQCTVHHNMFSAIPRSKVKPVAKMFKAIYTQESENATRFPQIEVSKFPLNFPS